MPVGPPPSVYDLHNRLRQTEAALRFIEKALATLFRRVNVNRRHDPELDAVLGALAAILHGLDHARGDRAGELSPPPPPGGYGLRLRIEESPDAVRVITQNAGEKHETLAAVIPTKLPEN